MIREFSEEKRDEIFRALDAIDNSEWQSFMAWCGGKASDFGDWPDRIELRTHTNYVDDYHQKILDINQMTRNQVNAVFENVAEIDTRYAGLMRECQEEIKEQIKTIQTMTEFMRSMNGGNLNMSLLTQGSVNESNISAEENDEKEVEVTETYCYWVRDRLSLEYYSIKECLDFIDELHRNGFVSDEDFRSIRYWNDVIDYVPSAEADKIRNLMQERFDHIITTVYIYNCLQVLSNKEFTPEDCCIVNDLFRENYLTNRNSIACFLICCAGESRSFEAVIEEGYNGDGDYNEEERGAGYLQLTWKENQRDFLLYYNMHYDPDIVIDPTKEGYAEEVSGLPWHSAIWGWAINKPIAPDDENEDGKSLNSYIMERLNENGGELTLGILLTAESFVNGVVSKLNACGTSTMNGALHVIARYDSLRHIDGEDDNGWRIEENKEGNYRLYILAEMLTIPDGTPDSDIPSEWNSTNWLDFTPPSNWDTFVEKYNALREYGLIDFDLITELP